MKQTTRSKGGLGGGWWVIVWCRRMVTSRMNQEAVEQEVVVVAVAVAVVVVKIQATTI